jgi:hypothetical protein
MSSAPTRMSGLRRLYCVVLDADPGGDETPQIALRSQQPADQSISHHRAAVVMPPGA